MKVFDNVLPEPQRKEVYDFLMDPGWLFGGNRVRPRKGSHSGTNIYDILVSALTFASICLRRQSEKVRRPSVKGRAFLVCQSAFRKSRLYQPD